MKETLHSFSHYPPSSSVVRRFIYWRDQHDLFQHLPVLPYGQSRSYGDCALNQGGVVIDTQYLNRFISFDTEQGILRCESGLRFIDVMNLIVPTGWSLPVIPGTQLLSIGGAVANDIHGKNHHREGSFGCHVLSLELLRSDGTRLNCSRTENSELFLATIGGMGLTGLVLSVEIQLAPMKSPFFNAETVEFHSLEEFCTVVEESDCCFEQTVAWLDMQAKQLRGLFYRGNLASEHGPGSRIKSGMTTGGAGGLSQKAKTRRIPFYFPSASINPWTVKQFNRLYFNRGKGKTSAIEHYQSFYSPLDGIRDWNKVYGKRGFVQHQSVIPFGNHQAVLCELVSLIRESKLGSFISVLKTFGEKRSGGLMSFPMPGVSLAQDILIRGDKTWCLLERLDQIVADAGGRIYAAKDATLSAEHYAQFYPNLSEFKQWRDPGFSSDLWRRVSGESK